MLVVVCGLPGVGKTTVARHATQRLDATLLRTDVIRKELVDSPEYTPEESRRVYCEMFDRAHALLAADEHVVLDATFTDAAERDRAHDLADETDTGLWVLRVTCDVDTVRERLPDRDGDASDADFDIHLQLRETRDPLECDHDTVDNSGSLQHTARQVDAVLRDARGRRAAGEPGSHR